MLNQFSSDSDVGFGRLLELGGTTIQERMKTLFVFSFSSGTAGAHSALFLSDLKIKKKEKMVCCMVFALLTSSKDHNCDGEDDYNDYGGCNDNV